MDTGSPIKVNLIENLSKNQLIVEYKNNIRLQWMLVIIVGIIALSLLKQIYDALDTQATDTKSQLNLQARLNSAAKQSFDSATLLSNQKEVEDLLSSFSDIASSSTAEAQALQDIDDKIGVLLKRKRLNLIGSQEILAGNRVLWAVRIEVNGQLAEKDFIQVLSFFDANQKNARITSMQYSPKISNTISLVADLMYKRVSDD
ncbi:MAG: type II secretory pathway pseudopilin PulG [Paraglaciecola sp.]